MPESRWSSLPLALQTFSLERFSLAEATEHARRAGVSRIDLYNHHLRPTSTPAEIIAAKRLLSKARLEVSAYGSVTLNRDHERNTRFFDFATLVGIRNLIVEVERGGLESGSRLAEEYGIRLCLHTSGPGSRFEHMAALEEALRNAPSEVGVCVDTGHILRSNQNPEEWLARFAGRVYAVHLTDVADRGPVTHNVPLGKGHLNLDSLLKALLDAKLPPNGSVAVGFQANECARLVAPPGYPDAVKPLTDMIHSLVH